MGEKRVVLDFPRTTCCVLVGDAVHLAACVCVLFFLSLIACITMNQLADPRMSFVGVLCLKNKFFQRGNAVSNTKTWFRAPLGNVT